MKNSTKQIEISTENDLELSTYFEYGIETLELTAHQRKVIHDFYDDLSVWLSEHFSREEWQLYAQGSFMLGTVVRPIHKDDEFDLDLVLVHNVKKESTTQIDLKQDVGNALNSFCSAMGNKWNSFDLACESGKRCWTFLLSDGENKFHIDVLPSLPNNTDPKNPDELFITDTGLAYYQRTNPKAFKRWFTEKALLEQAERKALTAALNIEPLNDEYLEVPLRKAVQILKRNRDLYFVQLEQRKPPSILLTTLAAKAYQGEANINDALIKIISRIQSLIVEKADGSYSVVNPVCDEDFMDRYSSDPDSVSIMFEWLESLSATVYNLQNSTGFNMLQKELGNLLGQKQSSLSLSIAANEIREKKDNENLRISGGVISTVAVGSIVKKSDFYGDFS